MIGDGMKKRILIISICLIVISIILFLIINISINKNIKTNKKVIDTINNLIDIKDSMFEDNDFPALEIDGIDYKGILNIPNINLNIPVENFCNVGVQSACYVPYGSFSIVTTNLKDSMINYKNLEIGNQIYFIDMLGNRYAFEIKNIERVKKLDLLSNDYNMNLAVKNYFELSYTVYECE